MQRIVENKEPGIILNNPKGGVLEKILITIDPSKTADNDQSVLCQVCYESNAAGTCKKCESISYCDGCFSLIHQRGILSTHKLTLNETEAPLFLCSTHHKP